ncbi:unnamed protein product, partial [Bubo scandiacus]
LLPARVSLQWSEQLRQESSRQGHALATVSKEKELLEHEKAALEVRLAALQRDRQGLSEQLAEARSVKEMLESSLFEAQRHLSHLEITRSQMEIQLHTVMQAKEVIQGESLLFLCELEAERSLMRQERENMAQQLLQTEQQYNNTLKLQQTDHEVEINQLLQDLASEWEGHHSELQKILEKWEKEKVETEGEHKKKLFDMKQKVATMQAQQEEEQPRAENAKQEVLQEKEREKSALLETVLQTQGELREANQQLEQLRQEVKEQHEDGQVSLTTGLCTPTALWAAPFELRCSGGPRSSRRNPPAEHDLFRPRPDLASSQSQQSRIEGQSSATELSSGPSLPPFLPRCLFVGRKAPQVSPQPESFLKLISVFIPRTSLHKDKNVQNALAIIILGLFLFSVKHWQIIKTLCLTAKCLWLVLCPISSPTLLCQTSYTAFSEACLIVAQQAVTSNTCTASLVPLLSTTVSKSSVCRLFAIQSLGRKEKHLLFLLNWCCALNSFYPAGGPWESSDGGEVPTHLFWFGPRGQLGTMQPLAPSLLPPQGWGEEDKTKGSGIETRTMRDGPPPRGEELPHLPLAQGLLHCHFRVSREGRAAELPWQPLPLPDGTNGHGRGFSPSEQRRSAARGGRERERRGGVGRGQGGAGVGLIQRKVDTSPALAAQVSGRRAKFLQWSEQLRQESSRQGHALATVSKEKELLEHEKAALEVRLAALQRDRQGLSEQLAEARSVKEMLESSLFEAQRHLSHLEITRSQMEIQLHTVMQAKEVIQGEVKCLQCELEAERSLMRQERENMAQQLLQTEQQYNNTLKLQQTDHEVEINQLLQDLASEWEGHHSELQKILEKWEKEKVETEGEHKKKLFDMKQKVATMQAQQEEEQPRAENAKQEVKTVKGEFG